MEFDSLEPAWAPVRMVGERCTLVEATAAIVAAHDNRRMKGATLSEDGTVAKLEDLAGLRAYAVHLCLLRCEQPPADFTEQTIAPLRFPEQIVRSWRDVVVDSLYDAVKELSPTMPGGKQPSPKEPPDDGTLSSSTPTS